MSSDPVFGAAAILPRGPHALTRDDVATSQRLRIMGALAALMAEHGYAGTTIGALASRAGVSRAAFYEHFADKETCLSAAYEHYVGALVTRMLVDVPENDWEGFIEGTLAGYLGFLQDDPASARAFVVEMESAGPAARAQRRAALGAIAALLAERHAAMRRADGSLGPLPASAFVAIVHGVRGLVTDALEAEREPDLLALVPEIVVWIRASVQGA